MPRFDRYPIAVLCVLLSTGTLAVLGANAGKFRRENGKFNITPDATISAASDATCSISCTTMEPWFCGGFTYHDNGTCDLYRGNETAACVIPLVAGPPLEADTGRPPRVYRRLRQTCPGTGYALCACPAGFSLCAGRCLALLSQQLTYTDAEAACDELGAHLAVPRTEAENQCVINLAPNGNTYLGFSDRAEEGVYAAADGGEPLPESSPFWSTSQPDDFDGTRNCVQLWQHTWDDDYCDLEQASVCQLRSSHRPECP